jgi:glucosylglycerate synthase
MATANPLRGAETDSPPSDTPLLVHLAPLPGEQLKGVLTNLAACVDPGALLIATPGESLQNHLPALRMVAAPATDSSWIPTAADYVNAFQLAQEHNARAILMLGPESGSLRLPGLRALADSVAGTAVDLALPCYDLPPHAGLVNSAIFYPLSRALFASPARFPLTIDLGLSLRMAGRLAVAAQRLIALHQPAAPLWPVNEATAAGFAVSEFAAGARFLPQPAEPDLNAVFPNVVGSLFSDVEAKAAYWQRPRQLPSPRNHPHLNQVPAPDHAADTVPMVQAFRLAYSNLQEIWSLVLPPNSLLGLKRLSLTEGAAFRMPETLWARIVYDFLLAYRQRTINRGHLFGALIPLYLAWVASHINATASGAGAEQHIESVASAFETEKPYLVSRWRWPDRFNP